MFGLSLVPDDKDDAVVAVLLLAARCCLPHIQVFTARLVRSSVETPMAVRILHIGRLAGARFALVVLLLKDPSARNLECYF